MSVEILVLLVGIFMVIAGMTIAAKDPRNDRPHSIFLALFGLVLAGSSLMEIFL